MQISNNFSILGNKKSSSDTPVKRMIAIKMLVLYLAIRIIMVLLIERILVLKI